MSIGSCVQQQRRNRPQYNRRLHFLLAATAALVVSGPAAAQSINQFVGFGDSSIDSGFYRNNIVNGVPSAGGSDKFNDLFPGAVAEGAGRATSSPGLMSSELLASFFGTTATPANQPGGTNFATSGARNNEKNAKGEGFTEAIPTVTQINNYLALTGGVANPNALYLISSGGNNVGFAIDNLPPDKRAAYVVQAANDEIAAIVKLKAAGARYIIIPNLAESFGNATQRELRGIYNDALWNGLAAAGINFIPADFNGLRQQIQDNPSAFGFTTVSVNDPACQPVVDAAALLCATSKSGLVAPDADKTHLFADREGHFATAGQKIVADYYYSLVIAPSQISLLAENPIKTRASVIALIENQIPISQRVRGPLGFNVWAAGDVSRLKIDQPVGFVGESATPTMVTAGIDTVTSGGILMGLAVSASTKKPSFSLGGSYRQDEFAVSGYTAATLGPLWLNMIGTFGALHYDVNRVVPLGITLQQNNATTNGTNASLAVRFGHNTVTGLLTHGPVIGLTLQSVRVDGFTETGGGVTSLAFADQTRHSAVGVLGYQASFDAGMFRPFARVLWNHEFASSNRLVTATLTSTVAPSYSLPAVDLGKDWASASAGVAVTLGKGVTGIASFTGQLGQDKVTTYGGQLGLNVAF
jgi:outer membrane lipase/esterase